MSYIEPPLAAAGQHVRVDDYNLLVENIINHNQRIVNKEQEGIGAANLAVGSIIMYYGNLSDLPSGWAVCDGLNGTPDLRDKFVIGAGGTRYPGNTGGGGFQQVIS